MNEKTTIDERIKLVNEVKFRNFSLKNKILERQCKIFIKIASFSLNMRYNDFIKKNLNHLHKAKKLMFC